MNRIAEAEGLQLIGNVSDIFVFDDFAEFDFILLDSMFHFAKKDRKKEIDFVKKILARIKNGCLVIFCIQDIGKKLRF